MVRWVPDTAERLQRAALELFAARGYEQTTASEIADAVGLTERTFYRHFTDKREVLFHGQQSLTDAFVAGVQGAPPESSPIDLSRNAIRATADFFTAERRPHSRARQRVIDGNPALQEREALKLARLGRALADALCARGVDGPTADVAAQIGVTAFGITFARWIGDGEQRSFEDITDDVLVTVGDVTQPLRR